MSAAINIPRPGALMPGHQLLRTTEFNAIPPITDPMGRNWDQPPDIRLAVMDSDRVLLTKRQIEGLYEYSSSYPSGTYDGKCWMRENGATRWLCWYEPCDIPGQIGIGSREIIEVAP